MTIRQLSDLADANGLHAAITIAGGKAEQRSRARRMVAVRRRLVGYYESMSWRRGLGCVKPTRPRTDMPTLAPAGRHGR
jgi:hypothetical protein